MGAESDYQKTYSIPVNLTFGYQWYFRYEFGVQFKGYTGYANYNSQGIDCESISLDDLSCNKKLRKSSAIHYGLEASFLYDLLQREDITFGITGGLGYQFGTFIGQRLVSGDTGARTPEERAISKQEDVNLNSYTMSSYTYSSELYLAYLRHHYFGLSWRFTTEYLLPDKGGSITKNINGEAQTAKYQTSPQHAVLFSYSYLF